VGPTSPPPPASPSPSPEPLNVAAAIGVIPRSFHYFAVGQGESFRILLFDEDSGNPPLEVLRSGRPPAPAGPDVRSEAFSVSADGRVMFATAGRHGTTIDTQTDTGWIYRPIAWDRSANLAASGLTGNGGGLSFYVTVRINPDNTFTRQQVDTRSRTTFGMLMGSIKASTDAKLVLGVDFDSGGHQIMPASKLALLHQAVLANCDDSASKSVLVEAGWGEVIVAREQLYDLVLDPAEGSNLVADAPSQEVLAELRARLDAWVRETDDPLLEGPVEPPPGAAVNEPWQVSPSEPPRLVTEGPTAAPSR